MEDTGNAAPTPTASPDTAAPTTGTEVADWSPETIEDGTGVALDGDGLPVNHRLRAERLARDGKETDEGGMVPDELIADAAARLESIAAAYPAVRANMRTDDLTKIADAESVDLSTATNNVERVELITASRAAIGVTLEESR